MGARGITVRQNDDGLDLLDTIVAEQLRKGFKRNPGNVTFCCYKESNASL